VRRDGKLASAAHPAKERAFGQHALVSRRIIERAANAFEARIVLANFNSERGLSDAREHFFQGNRGSQQTVGHAIAFKLLRIATPEMEAFQSGGGEENRIELWLLRKLAQSRAHVAPNRHDVQVRPQIQQVRAATCAARRDRCTARQVTNSQPCRKRPPC
jgi:hypothetical protein